MASLLLQFARDRLGSFAVKALALSEATCESLKNVSEKYKYGQTNWIKPWINNFTQSEDQAVKPRQGFQYSRQDFKTRYRKEKKRPT
jgi:hypothetical protein